MIEIIAVLFLILYSVDILMLFVFGVHAYIMVLLSRRNKDYCLADAERPEEEILNIDYKDLSSVPYVTVQLPVFNEYYVVERLIHRTMEMDWPKERFEVQVLDDSTDDARLVAERVVEQYKAKGFDIHHIHRTVRTDHKAGALREGLEICKGEYVAVFDADFMPQKEFLKKTIPMFGDDNVGMVQTRWGHINADYSLLTKVQSIGIDGHFVIEQVARNANSLWINFNGTGGVWRKTCIIDAGNWSGDTLTEDFDLSYRAELNGWKFRYLKDVEVPAELPPLMAGFKSQQFRWCKGSIQTAIKLLPTIFRKPLSWKIKLEALVHLTSYTVHPLIILNILCTVPMLIIQGFPHFVSSKDSALYPILSDLSGYNDIAFYIFALGFVLSVGTFGPAVFYAYSQKQLYTDWKKRSALMPFLMMIGTGIAIVNTRAWLEAVLGIKSGFKRTPKLGVADSNQKFKNRKRYKSKLDFHVVLEYLMGLICGVGIFLSFYTGFTWVVFFLFIYMLGFFYVATATIYQSGALSNLFRFGRSRSNLPEASAPQVS